jgi:ribosome-associated protein
MSSETTVKKDIQKLQRAIVDGLEDVKGQDIVVFNTEQLSPLFERVIIASGTSNRQTKALAASVRDAVKDAGFDKPRIEGEDNGEWIIVDCGQAVAHVMQPVIRQYYRLEEIWGAKPVRLKTAAEKAAEAREAAAKKTATKTTRKGEVKDVKPVDAKSLARKQAKATAAAKAAPAPAKAPAKKAAAKTATKTPAKPVAKTAAAKLPAKKVAAKKTAPKATMTKVVVNKPKPAAKPAAAKKAAPKKKA